ncbi:penicillin-binding protein [Lentzea sp. NBRC 105346]|nr:penicillin-binding protein [Lentzea sp. NBRC 105346]
MLITGGVTTSAIIGVAAAVVFGSGSDPNKTPYKPPPTSPNIVAQAFLTAITNGDGAKAANQTDNPPAAGAALSAQSTGMGKAVFSAVLKGGSGASLPADVTWKLPNGTPFTYTVEIGMQQVNDQWKVHWAPTVLHPKLAEGQHLEFRKAIADDAMLGPDGTKLNPDVVPPALMNAITASFGGGTGTDGWEVGITSASGFVPLAGEKPAVPDKITVTIDAAAQKSAQAAVDALPQGAAIVAIDPRTTEIRAVASNKALDSNPFGGQYPPGSTLKVVTGAAALQNNLVSAASTPVDCPEVATVGTRRVPNDGFGHGSQKIPFSQAFAESCNTTFAMLGHQLSRDALGKTALQFGLGTDYVMAGTDSNTGRVPPADSDNLQVEDSFGQGNVTASPFGMALVAATVASGRQPTPTLVRGKAAEITSGAATPPSEAVLRVLRTGMRECITYGTGKSLARFGGLYGKTGTAESAEGAHGWFIGYRGNIAFAVFVKGAGSSTPALSAAGQFLSALS